MRFFFGFLAFIAAIVVVVLVVIGLVKTVNSGNSKINISQTINLLDDSSIDSVARYTVTSPIVANENYRETRLTVSKNSRTLEVLHGYDKAVEKSTTLGNTTSAYKAFLGALSAAQFSAKRDGVEGNPMSVCVTGNHFLYELQLGNEKKVDTWTTTCSLSSGTFGGNVDGVSQLFRDQFPDYTNLSKTSDGTYNLAPL
ncbi:hypothetical protein KC930_01540 [Candidatus Saccharibacteria bacterium]|nr:hypothetical protein [Candidatus Saccharibacteria bacterium]